MKLVKWIVFCIAACSLLAGCRKKDVGVFIPAGVETLGAEEGWTVEVAEESVGTDEETEVFAQGKDPFADVVVASASDFEYALTDNLEGVKLIKYKGAGTKVEILSEIEGMPVIELCEKCFARNKALTTVVIPDSVKKIGNELFEECESLRYVRLPKDISYISANMFSECKSLEEFVLPSSIEWIGDWAFQGTGLKSIVIPKSVELGRGVFSGCVQLVYVELPEDMTALSKHLFYACSSLKKITLPESITRLEDESLPGEWLTELAIPKNVVYIGSMRFKALKSIEMPDSVEVSFAIFADCTSLEYAHLSDSLKSIPSRCFENCTSLKTVNFPASLESMGEKVFNNLANLENLIIPDSLTRKVKFYSWVFEETKLPLATQVRLRKLGCDETFKN